MYDHHEDYTTIPMIREIILILVFAKIPVELYYCRLVIKTIRSFPFQQNMACTYKFKCFTGVHLVLGLSKRYL